MLTPAALSISSWLSNRPRIVSTTPYSTNTPPMMRRRSKRLAARRVEVVSDIGYQKMMVRMAAPASAV